MWGKSTLPKVSLCSNVYCSTIHKSKGVESIWIHTSGLNGKENAAREEIIQPQKL